MVEGLKSILHDTRAVFSGHVEEMVAEEEDWEINQVLQRLNLNRGTGSAFSPENTFLIMHLYLAIVSALVHVGRSMEMAGQVGVPPFPCSCCCRCVRVSSSRVLPLLAQPIPRMLVAISMSTVPNPFGENSSLASLYATLEMMHIRAVQEGQWLMETKVL